MTRWATAGAQWLERAAHEEWKAQGCPVLKKGRGQRYVPPPWQVDAVAALGRLDEETFKAIKLAQIAQGATA